MSTSKKSVAESARNYSADQEAVIKDAEPLNLEKAKALEPILGKGYKSIIAKALSMGVEYHKQEPAPKRPAKETKAEIVEEIMAITEWDLSGLKGATLRALNDLRGALLELAPEKAEQRLAMLKDANGSK